MNIDQLQTFQSKTVALATPFATPVTTIVALLLNADKAPTSKFGSMAAAHWDNTFHKKAKEQVRQYQDYLMIDSHLAVEMARKIYINRCNVLSNPVSVVFDAINSYRYVNKLATVIPEETAIHIFFYTLDSIQKYKHQLAALGGINPAAYRSNRIFNTIVEETYENYINENNPGTLNRFYDEIMTFITDLVAELMAVVLGQSRIREMLNNDNITSARTMRLILTGLYQDKQLAELICAHFYSEDHFEVLLSKEPSSKEEDLSPSDEEEASMENFAGTEEEINALRLSLEQQGFTTLMPHNLQYLKKKDPELFEGVNINMDEEISLEGFFARVGKGIQKTVRKIVQLIINMINKVLRIISAPFDMTPTIFLDDPTQALEAWQTTHNSLLHEFIEDMPVFISDPKVIRVPISECKALSRNISFTMMEKLNEFKVNWAEGNFIKCQSLVEDYEMAIKSNLQTILSIPSQLVFDEDVKMGKVNLKGDLREAPGVVRKYIADQKAALEKLGSTKVKKRGTSDEALKRCYSIAKPSEWEDLTEELSRDFREVSEDAMKMSVTTKAISFDWNPSASPEEKEISATAKKINNLYLEHAKLHLVVSNIVADYGSMLSTYAYAASQMGVNAREILDK